MGHPLFNVLKKKYTLRSLKFTLKIPNRTEGCMGQFVLTNTNVADSKLLVGIFILWPQMWSSSYSTFSYDLPFQVLDINLLSRYFSDKLVFEP